MEYLIRWLCSPRKLKFMKVCSLCWGICVFFYMNNLWILQKSFMLLICGWSFRLRWTWSTSWRLSPSTSLSSWRALRTLRSSARLARSSGWSRWTSHHHYTDTLYWAHIKLQFKLLTHVTGDADLESVSACSSLCWTSVSLLYTPAGFWQSFTFLHIHFHCCHFHFHLCRSSVTVPHTQAGFWQKLTFTFSATSFIFGCRQSFQLADQLQLKLCVFNHLSLWLRRTRSLAFSSSWLPLPSSPSPGCKISLLWSPVATMMEGFFSSLVYFAEKGLDNDRKMVDGEGRKALDLVNLASGSCEPVNVPRLGLVWWKHKKDPLPFISFDVWKSPLMWIRIPNPCKSFSRIS